MKQYDKSMTPEAAAAATELNSNRLTLEKLDSDLSALESRFQEIENSLKSINRQINEFRVWQSQAASIINRKG